MLFGWTGDLTVSSPFGEQAATVRHGWAGKSSQKRRTGKSYLVEVCTGED
jgi:hypothetical protein